MGTSVERVARNTRPTAVLPRLVVNRLPGLQSSKQNLEEENNVYDKMMTDLVRLVVVPHLLGCPRHPGLFEVLPHARDTDTPSLLDSPRSLDQRPHLRDDVFVVH